VVQGHTINVAQGHTISVVVSGKQSKSHCYNRSLIVIYGLSNNGNSDDLGWPTVSFTYYKPFQMWFRVQLWTRFLLTYCVSQSLHDSWAASCCVDEQIPRITYRSLLQQQILSWLYRSFVQKFLFLLGSYSRYWFWTSFACQNWWTVVIMG